MAWNLMIRRFTSKAERGKMGYNLVSAERVPTNVAGYTMTRNMTRRWVLTVAVAGVMMTAGPLVYGQYQVDNSSGRARDANPRLGSGGFNDTRALPNGVTSDDIVYGNVTRGQEFRGQLRTTDARAFRGTTAGTNVDNFVKDSAGAGQNPNTVLTPQPFYGESRAAAPPKGFEKDLASGSFTLPRPPEAGNSAEMGDYRLNGAVLRPGIDTIVLPGDAVGTSDPSRLVVISPLTGVVGQPTGAAPLAVPIWQAQATALSDTALEGNSSRTALRRLQMDESSIRMMREELTNTSLQTDQPSSADQLNKASNLLSPEAPQNPVLDSSLSSQLGANPLGGSLDTSASMRQTLITALPAAARQSTQYAELQSRLQAYQERGLSADQRASRDYNEQVRLAQEQEKGKAGSLTKLTQPDQTGGAPDAKSGVKPDTSTPLQMAPGGARMAAAMRNRDLEQGVKTPTQGNIPGETVLRITSFADGVKAIGLKKLLVQAETNMRDGKFTAALDDYDAASAVAPNNPLILLARANAELGAGYYARAQAHIQEIFKADSSLLLAQYDLRKFYGEDRLQYLVRDLKDVAQTEPNDFRPFFLLGYIAYNTNNPQRASDYLAMAEKRGDKDPLLSKLREFWKLPAPGALEQSPDNK